tara:strand:+ start:1684 stop:2181 length:498 start_codon:yes stop_codon:yes gene_type:complete
MFSIERLYGFCDNKGNRKMSNNTVNNTTTKSPGLLSVDLAENNSAFKLITPQLVDNGVQIGEHLYRFESLEPNVYRNKLGQAVETVQYTVGYGKSAPIKVSKNGKESTIGFAKISITLTDANLVDLGFNLHGVDANGRAAMLAEYDKRQAAKSAKATLEKQAPAM